MVVNIALVVGLVILNAAFSGSEMALVSLREGQVARLAGRGRAGRALAGLAGDPNRFLSTIQIGITLAGFLASATAAVSLADPLVSVFGFLGGAADAAAIVVVTIVLTFFTLVLGELAPKRLAMQRPEGWALVAARPLAAVARVVRPLVWLLARSTDAVVRLLGGDPRSAREQISEEEIRDLIASHESIPPSQREILTGAFELDDRRLWQVLKHRSDVFGLRADTPIPEARSALVASGYSRAPVHTGSFDDFVGVVHLRDLVDAEGLVGDVVREAVVLYESLGVLDALRRLQAERAQLAVVIDEHGGMAGIVTVEDLLEEIVGEIYDEFDRDLSPLRRGSDGVVEVPGSFPVHDLIDLGLVVSDEDHATLAGLLYEAFGDVPDVGERTDVGGWSAEVLEMDGPAIERVLLTPPRARSGPADEVGRDDDPGEGPGELA